MSLGLLAASDREVAGTTAGDAATEVPVTTSRGEFSLLVYRPAPLPASQRSDALPLVLLVSGEGGWRGFDEDVAGHLRGAGYWVGGIDAMKYFWTAQDDRQALTADMRAYGGALAAAAGSDAEATFVLAGFSFGADLAPWVAGAGGWGGRVKGLVLIGPDEEGSLEFRIMEMLGFRPKSHIFSVASALKDSAGIPAFFLHGEKDSGSAAPALAAGAGEPKKISVVPGANHHFSGHEEEMRIALLEGVDWLRRQKPAHTETAPHTP